MATPDRSALVLYGSETGNAQDMAEELGRVFQRLHFQSTVEELDAIDLVRLSSLALYQRGCRFTILSTLEYCG